jgi:hypothetical protein
MPAGATPMPLRPNFAVTAFHGLSQIHDYGLGLLALVWIMAPWSGGGATAPGRRAA